MNKAHGIFLTKGFGMNDLVEDKFVAWINSQVGYNYFDCFLAGRESMREDAMRACLNQFNAGNNIAGTDCAKAIKEIP
jgi:hypothetical protein